MAENSGGPHCLKYGVTTRYTTGLRVVLADGEVIWLGGQGRESPSYDLVGLFTGSEGCFGLATEIEVALLPLPEAVRTLLAIFDTLEDAGRAVTAIVSAGLLPAALEIVDQNCIKAVEASIFAAGYPTDAGAALVVEFDGLEAGLDEEAAEAERHCLDAGAREVRRAETAAERIQAFHEGQSRQSWIDWDQEGGALGQILRPLERVGIYAPGGRAPYPSSLLMAAVPARVAGVQEVVVASPPGKDGRVHDVLLAAAQVAGADAVYKAGGAQAVGALGGLKVQGKSVETARKVVRESLELQEAGAFAIIFEAVPAKLSAYVTQKLRIPTISIGGGPGCSGHP